MDARTLDVYEQRAGDWVERRGALPADSLGSDFRAEVGDGLIIDLGCGTGRYLDQLARPIIGLDASAAMLGLAKTLRHPLVRGDIEMLPIATGSVSAAFARHSFLHVHRARLGDALAELRRVLKPGGVVLLSVIEGTYEGHRLADDDFPGRYFALWTRGELETLFFKAGFTDVRVDSVPRKHGGPDLVAKARWDTDPVARGDRAAPRSQAVPMPVTELGR